MTFPDITRSEFRRIDERARGDSGKFAGMLVAAHYGVEYTPDEAEWYDCKNPDTETKFESKSAHTTIDGLDPSRYHEVDGRFRVWKSQTRSLINSDAQGTAWVVFVLFDSDGNPIDHRRMRPSTVWAIVRDEFGGWDDSGHQMGPQQKLPIDAVFDR